MKISVFSLTVLMLALLGIGLIGPREINAQEKSTVAEAPSFRVVCFGDSITGHRPKERFNYQKHYIKYSDMLEILIAAQMPEENVQVVNSGWSGDATFPKKAQGFPGAVARVKPDILDFKPDIAVILIGGNDGWKEGDQAARDLTRKNLTSIMKQCKDAGIKTLVLTYHRPLPAPEHESKGWKQLAQKNDMIREVAKGLELPVLDIDVAMQAAAKKYPRNQLADAKDGVHLRPRGEMVFASAIYAKLSELGWLKVSK